MPNGISPSPFPFKVFSFHTNFDVTFCKQTVPPRTAASDLSRHYLLMSHKQDARIILVKHFLNYFADVLQG